MRTVFADAGFWIALRDEKDEWHPAAKAIAIRLMQERVRLVTTPFVFAEAHARFSRSAILRARVIRDFWENPVVTIETPTHGDQMEALDLLRAQKDKSYSFCDALSFSLMRRMGLWEAVTFDDHFRQVGKFEIIDQ